MILVLGNWNLKIHITTFEAIRGALFRLTLFVIMHKIYDKGFYLKLYETIDGSYFY